MLLHDGQTLCCDDDDDRSDMQTWEEEVEIKWIFSGSLLHTILCFLFLIFFFVTKSMFYVNGSFVDIKLNIIKLMLLYHFMIIFNNFY